MATDADYKALRSQKEMSGKLVSIDGVTITVRAEYPHYEANPKYKAPKAGQPGNGTANQQAQLYRAYNELMREQAVAAKARTPQEYQRAMQRVAQDMNRLQQEIYRLNQTMAKGGQKVDPNNQPFIIKTSTKDFDLELVEKVVFRKMELPFEYDDTGKVKTYTEKEKAELRGDDKSKPGYMAKIDEFVPGQEVKLTLAPPKKKPVEKDAEKDKDTPVETQRPTVSLVVMTKDNPTSAISGAPDRKKKK
jgi:hypothetical protein